MIIITSVIGAWLFLGMFAKLTGKEFHLDLVERACTALEWVARWLNRLAGASRAFSEHYRTLLERDLEDLTGAERPEPDHDFIAGFAMAALFPNRQDKPC